MIAINQYISLPQIRKEVADIEHTIALCNEIVCELVNTYDFLVFEEYPEIPRRLLRVLEIMRKLQEERNPTKLYFGVRAMSAELLEIHGWLSEIYEDQTCSEAESATRDMETEW